MSIVYFRISIHHARYIAFTYMNSYSALLQMYIENWRPCRFFFCYDARKERKNATLR